MKKICPLFSRLLSWGFVNKIFWFFKNFFDSLHKLNGPIFCSIKWILRMWCIFCLIPIYEKSLNRIPKKIVGLWAHNLILTHFNKRFLKFAFAMSYLNFYKKNFTCHFLSLKSSYKRFNIQKKATYSYEKIFLDFG